MTWSTLVAALRPSIRAGLAPGLAVAIARPWRLPFPPSAMITAVIVTDLAASRTRQLGLPRLTGTVLGTTPGAAVHPWLPPAAWSAGLGIRTAMFLSHVLRLPEAAKVAGFVRGIVMLDHGDHPWSYARYRAAEAGPGIGMAVLVSLVSPLAPIDEPTREGP